MVLSKTNNRATERSVSAPDFSVNPQSCKRSHDDKCAHIIFSHTLMYIGKRALKSPWLPWTSHRGINFVFPKCQNYLNTCKRRATYFILTAFYGPKIIFHSHTHSSISHWMKKKWKVEVGEKRCGGEAWKYRGASRLWVSSFHHTDLSA